MKIKFKDSNFVAHVKKTPKLEEAINNNDLEEISRIVLNHYDDIATDLSLIRDRLVYLTVWGLLLTASGSTNGIFLSDFYQSLVPFFATFTGICTSLGIATHISSKIFEKKYNEMFEIRKKIHEEKKKERVL